MSEKDDKKPSDPSDDVATKMVLYVHFFVEKAGEGDETKQKGLLQTIKLSTQSKNLRVMDLKMQIMKTFDSKGQNVRYKPISISKTIFSPPLRDTTKIRLYFEDKDDIFVKVETEAIPVATTTENKKDDVLSYKAVTDYSFYEANESTVKVLVPVPGIDKCKREHVIPNFLEDSFDVKVNNPTGNGVNYRFAVPKLDCKIIPEKCDAFPKGDRLIIKLRKFKNDDHWSYLFKQKYVGE